MRSAGDIGTEPMNLHSIGRPKDFAGYFDTARTPLVDLLEPSFKPGRVLDIGCGAGATLALLKSRYPAAEAIGIEAHPPAADLARKRCVIDRVIEADILGSEWQLAAGEAFDLVVISHVLEHFAQPEQLLHAVKRLLSPVGVVLVAVPNMRHASVVFPLLLFGEFRYRDAGVLDATHLRFFTARSAARLYRDNGFEVSRMELEVGGTRSRLLLALSLGLGRSFAAFGINALLRMNDADRACPGGYAR